MKKIITTSAVLAALAIAGCGGGNSNGKVERDIKAQAPYGMKVDVSCSHNQGNEYTCKVGDATLGSLPNGLPILNGPGIYSVTDDPSSRRVFYTKTG